MSASSMSGGQASESQASGSQMSAGQGGNATTPNPAMMFSMIQVGHAYGGRAPAILTVAWIGVVLTGFLIAGRLVLRVRKGKLEKWHDLSMWLALISWIVAVAGTCLLTISVSHGFGNHTHHLSLPNLIQATKYLWIGIALATFSTSTSKASVAAFLLALQGKSAMHRHWAIFLYFMGISNIVLNFIAVFTIIYQCKPVSASWNPTIHAESCYDRDHLFGPVALTHASWTAFSDFALAVYPIYIVHKLQIAFGIKVYLSIVLGLGLIACGFSFVKLALLKSLVYHRPTDPMWSIPLLVIWGWAELWLVLISLSVPPIWPLAKPVIATLTSLFGGSYRRHQGSSGYAHTAEVERTTADARRASRAITQTKDVIIVRETQSSHSLSSSGHDEKFEV